MAQDHVLALQHKLIQILLILLMMSLDAIMDLKKKENLDWVKLRIFGCAAMLQMGK